MLTSNFFSIKKTNLKKNTKFWNNFLSSFWIYTSLGYFIRTAYQLNSQSMNRHDKQKATRDSWFVRWKKRIPWNKIIAGVMSATWKLQLLESDPIVWQLSFWQMFSLHIWIFNLLWQYNMITIFVRLSQKKVFVDRFVDTLLTGAVVCKCSSK